MEHAEAIRIFYRHTSAASAQAPGPGETDIGATAQTMKTGISRFAKKAEGLKAPVLIFHPPKAAYHCTPQGGGGAGHSFSFWNAFATSTGIRSSTS